MEQLRIYFFGTFRLYRNGVLLSSKDWQIRHARQLFKLLFTERSHTVSVDKVIDLLWPYSAEHAHKTLRGAVSILRTVLEPTRAPQAPSRFVPRGSTGYTLYLPDDNSVWIDVFEFERLLESATIGHDSPKRRRVLEAALQLYTGDYLAEDEQESWAIAERARLREHYFSATLILMESQRKLGLHNEVINVGRRALSIDVCREPLYPLIMYSQAALGDTVGALQTFEQCRQELHNRLGLDPAPQTLKLHTELLQGAFRAKTTKASQNGVKQNVQLTQHTPSTDPLMTVSSPIQRSASLLLDRQECSLVAHKEQCAWLVQHLQALKEERAQEQRVIALAGEMGIGKSFLLRNILSSARTLQITTLSATCQVIEQGVAFATLITMMKAWLSGLHNEDLSMLPRPTLATLAHILPELLTRVPNLVPTAFLCPQQIQNALIAAFVDGITALCAQRSLLVTVDDVQWADEASLMVFHQLAQHEVTNAGEGRLCSLLIILAYRPEDVLENAPLHTMLLSFGRNSSIQTFPLQRFNRNELEAYVQMHDTSHVLSPDALYQVTQGNALFLTEAVRMLIEQREHYILLQKLYKHNPVMNALLHSQPVHDAVLARVTRLPQRAIELLEYAAVIGHPFPPAMLIPCLSSEEYKALDVLLARQFLCEQDGEEHTVYLMFVHEVVAQIVYMHCSALKRSLLHHYIAEQLTRYYANVTYKHATEIAFHYRCAGPQYQTQALHYEVQVENHLTHIAK